MGEPSAFIIMADLPQIPTEIQDAVTGTPPAPPPAKKTPKRPRKKQESDNESGISLGRDEKEFISKKRQTAQPIDISTEEEEEEEEEAASGVYSEVAESVYSEETASDKELSYLFYHLSKSRHLIKKWIERHEGMNWGSLRGHLA
jgi:hypothetical protein